MSIMKINIVLFTLLVKIFLVWLRELIHFSCLLYLSKIIIIWFCEHFNLLICENYNYIYIFIIFLLANTLNINVHFLS